MSIKTLSIRQKLFFVIGVTTLAGLLFAFAAFFTYNAFILSVKQANKVSALSKILASNSEAAVSFGDKEAAGELLEALEEEPHVRAAAIYDQSGRLFVRYGENRVPDRVNPSEIRDKVTFRKKYFHVFRPIIVQGQQAGIIYLKADTVELVHLFKQLAMAGLGIVLLCALLSFIIASLLEKNISEPIVQLSNVAKNVSAQKDYSLRAPKLSEDEMGHLVESFNEMLSEIQKRDEALVRSNQELEQFAYVASHDLQEPLRAVSSFSSMLAENTRGKLDEESAQYVSYLREGAVRASVLIRDLLEYSRARNQSRPFERVSLEEIFSETTATFRKKLEETGSILTHDPLPDVMGDRMKLSLLFQNLISNALKFQKKGTKPKIHVSVKKENDHWLFGVHDNGIGIDEKYREQIFVIFQRLHSRQEFEGTGIGLAICRSILEGHKGKIWVEVNNPEGSIFYFTLPR